jgi:hypothetical protein
VTLLTPISDKLISSDVWFSGVFLTLSFFFTAPIPSQSVNYKEKSIFGVSLPKEVRGVLGGMQGRFS